MIDMVKDMPKTLFGLISTPILFLIGMALYSAGEACAFYPTGGCSEDNKRELKVIGNAFLMAAAALALFTALGGGAVLSKMM